MLPLNHFVAAWRVAVSPEQSRVDRLRIAGAAYMLERFIHHFSNGPQQVILRGGVYRLLDRKKALGKGIGCAHRRIPERGGPVL